MATPTISAVINTRNEERNIRYCLESVRWCDEIVVVDMESEDRTVELCREYTEKVFFHPKVLAFDAARKFAVDRAAGDWVLLIDADEMVPRSLSAQLRELARSDTVDVVQIPFQTYIMGTWIRHTLWWPEYHPRFFRRGAVTFSETVHAYMSVSSDARSLVLPPAADNAIAHFAYRDSEHFVEKLNRYTTIEARHRFDGGRRPSVIGLLASAAKEFAARYVLAQGFRDGYRGFALSLMMGFYRALTHIKLWELSHNPGRPVEEQYAELKQSILEGHRAPASRSLDR